ncbi:MAG TPA: hypothetical protein VGE51_02760 [Fontimonas sp.]
MAVLAICALTTPLPAAALSLGTPEVRSSLGEPLRLEVAIESDRSAGGLPVAQLIDAAGNETWTVAGVTGALRLDIVALDDVHQRLEIRSSQPVWEPLLMLRVEVSQAAMRIVRELPVMLDPPASGESMWSGVAGTAEPVAALEDSATPATPPPIAAASAAPALAPPPVATARPQPEPAASDEDFTLPAPRFQLAAALSTYSLAWLQDHPAPANRTDAPDPALDGDELEPESTIDAQRGHAEPATAAVRRGEPAAKPQAKAEPLPPRGLPMGSPWRVFLVMSAVAIGLFLHARRLRRRGIADTAALA